MRNVYIAQDCLKLIMLFPSRTTYSSAGKTIKKNDLVTGNFDIDFDISLLWLISIIRRDQSARNYVIEWLNARNLSELPVSEIDDKIYVWSNFNTNDTSMLRFMSYPDSANMNKINNIATGAGTKIRGYYESNSSSRKFYQACLKRIIECERPVFI